MRLLPYGVAILSVVLALRITLLLEPWMRDTPAQLFFVAVMVSAWYGGLGSGLLATVLSTLAINYFLIEPYFSLKMTNLGTVVQMGVFVMAALLISGLNQSRYMALRQSRANLSERQQAEAALQESTAILNAINQTSPTLIFVKDWQGRILMANPATLEAIGKSKAETIGKTDAELHLNREEGEQMMENDRQVMQTGQVQVFEEVLQVPAGRRTFLSNKSPYRDPQGNIIGLIGVAFDVTERKQAEAALQESEVRFRQMAETIDDVFWLLDPQSQQMLYISPAYEQIWGRSPESLCNDVSQWIETIHSDDRAQVRTAVSQCITKGSHETEYRVVRPDGTVRWVRDRGFLIRDERGQPDCITGVAQDITERKQAEATLRHSEERYRYLAESIPQLVWTANANGQITDTNQRWFAYTGLTLAQVQIEGWQAIIHPDDIPTLSQQWVAAQQAGVHYRAEGRIRRADGAYRWYLHEAIPLKNQQGQVIKWFGTATDVEDQKQLERQRQRLFEQEQAAREQAEQANRIKDEFLAVLSHELRSPLNPILGWTRLLQNGKLDAARQLEALATIERNAKLQTQLIEDLLDISRIMQGKLSLTAAPISLTFVITAAVETVRLAAAAKQIQILLDLGTTVAPVSGDAARLQQVVWNLLINAVKFTPNGGQVTVELRQLDQLAQIRVIDTGKGINPQFLPHVFDYFRQADSTTTRKFGGLGLGLAIVRQIVEMHGGTVTVKSEGENQGATFTVQLPILQQAIPAVFEPARVAAENLAAPLSNLQILVVDDDRDTREFQTFLLEQSGAKVTAVASGLEALQVLEQFVPDVLVSDVGMAEMDGYTLIQQIRSREASRNDSCPPAQERTIPAFSKTVLPAIALTAYARDFDQQKAFEAGFQAHLTKPVEPEVLVRTIVNLLQENGDRLQRFENQKGDIKHNIL